MKQLLCATGNAEKFGYGKNTFARYGIELVQVKLDIDEIQGEDPEAIIRDKAQRAFEKINKPVVVTDDTWDFPGLNGFPGPYMKSINRWFIPDDIIRLTRGLKDRRVLLHEYVCFQDQELSKIFNSSLSGMVADEPRGNFGPTIMKVAVMDTDDGKTISEVFDAGKGHSPERLAKRDNSAWEQLAQWYSNKIQDK